MLLHRKVHDVSHFQVALFDAAVGDAYPEGITGSALVVVGTHGVAVSTAWDDDGRSKPAVEIVVHLVDDGAVALDGLMVLAEAHLSVGDRGVQVGNAITGDLGHLPQPRGRFVVVIAADRCEPFKARTVAFHLVPSP